EVAASMYEYTRLLANPSVDPSNCVKPYQAPAIAGQTQLAQSDPNAYPQAFAGFLDCISEQLFAGLDAELRAAFDAHVEEENQIGLKVARARAEAGFHEKLRTNLAAVVLR